MSDLEMLWAVVCIVDAYAERATDDPRNSAEYRRDANELAEQFRQFVDEYEKETKVNCQGDVLGIPIVEEEIKPHEFCEWDVYSHCENGRGVEYRSVPRCLLDHQTIDDTNDDWQYCPHCGKRIKLELVEKKHDA